MERWCPRISLLACPMLATRSSRKSKDSTRTNCTSRKTRLTFGVTGTSSECDTFHGNNMKRYLTVGRVVQQVKLHLINEENQSTRARTSDYEPAMRQMHDFASKGMHEKEKLTGIL